jgi:phospholipase A-2-activating protein
MAAVGFVLSAELRFHEQDVKAVCRVSGGRIGSAGRDRAVVVWAPAEDGERPPYRPVSSHTLHEHFVNSICETGSSQLASGAGSGNGGSMRMWDMKSPEATLVPGHTKNVCTLAVAPDGNLLSGSWDNSAMVWPNGDRLSGHEGAVWAVLGLENGDIATASADKTIKLWRDLMCIKTLGGHTDAVRALRNVPGLGFISASNDGTAKLWSNAGEELATFPCHEQYIYGLTVLSANEFATVSEDKSLKVFRDGQSVQTIQHPGVVWSVDVLPSGDLVTGCQDGVVRIWTREADRAAPGEEVMMYEEQLAAQTIATQQAGSVDPSKLPGPEALQTPGEKDGQTKLVRSSNGGAEAHSWSEADGRWIMVGTVVDGPSGGGGGGGASGGMVNGVAYDFVFDVDLEDGSSMRKLGVNRGEDPYFAAHRFLENEGLPTSSANVDQITEFIQQQVGGFSIGEEQQMHVAIDPLTGAGAYVPGGIGSAGDGVVSDAEFNMGTPFGGGYRPPPAGAATTTQQGGDGGGFNPWLPADRYVPGGAGAGGGGAAASAAPAPPPAVNFPVLTMAVYSKGNIAGMAKKIGQFVAELGEGEHALTAEQSTQLTVLLEALAAGTGGDGSVVVVTEECVALLQRLLLWPDEKVFPVVDLCKKLLLSPSMATQTDVMAERLHSRVLEIGERMMIKLPNGHYATAEKVRYANMRLVLEYTANQLSTGRARGMLRRLIPRYLGVAVEGSGRDNKTERRAALATMLNCSVAFFLDGEQVELQEAKATCITALNSYLQTEVHRCLTAGAFDSDTVALDSALSCLGNVLQDPLTQSAALGSGIRESLAKFQPLLSPPHTDMVAALLSKLV